MASLSQTTLLRLAAFLVDALSFALLLIVPASILSYGIVWFGAVMKAIPMIWWVTILILFLLMLFRDGYRGRSPGKRLLGLRVQTADGSQCSAGRSLMRNFPLLVPGWNLVELIMVLFAREGRRSGDRIAGTTVTEE